MALYADIDIALVPDTATQDIPVLTDEDAVKQSVRLLVLTSLYERPFQPSLGSTVRRLLFEPMDDITKMALAQSIKSTIDQFEPRAQVKLVDIYTTTGPSGQRLDDHELVIVVTFAVYNRPNLVSTDFFLRRIR